jgi:DNA-binding IclR family transcriptional regulator
MVGRTGSERVASMRDGSAKRGAAHAEGAELASRTRAPIVRRPRKAESEAGDTADSRLFVAALARGLEILGSFRIGDGPLGNQELARRSGLPKPTVSRMTHTLTQLGYLAFDQRTETYELGGRALSLGYAAISNLDIRRVARPIVEEVVERGNVHVALTIRDKLMILAVETWEGKSLVGLRLSPGARMPIATTAGGKALLATLGEGEREAILDQVRRQHGDEWPRIRRSVEDAAREIERHGYCLSLGEWQSDINGAGAGIRLPNGSVYALALGGPAYLVGREQLVTESGPMLAAAARRIEAQLGAEGKRR